MKEEEKGVKINKQELRIGAAQLRLLERRNNRAPSFVRIARRSLDLECRRRQRVQ